MPVLDWIGKKAVVNHHRQVPYRLLHCDKSKSAGDPDAGNLLVQADNLEALKALLPYYAGKVKCIYIDPPYNTGNESWIYNDNLNSPEINAWLGKVVGKEAEDLSRHDKWLCMMYPRLRLLKEFLHPEGVVFISLDDVEAPRCRLICSDIFGENNFIANFIWKKMDSPSSNVGERIVSNYHDHILCYARDRKQANLVQLPSPDILKAYPVQMDGMRARWRQLRKNGKAARRVDRPNSWFPMTAPDGTELWPIHPKEHWEGRWSIGPDTWEKIKDSAEVKWEKRPYGWMPYRIEFASETPTMPMPSIIDAVGQNRQAKAQLNQILGTNHGFETPKPFDLVEQLISLCGDTDAIVMDSFCGSGTTGHAVLSLNKRDGGSRQFILIEIDEAISAQVAVPRLKNVIDGFITVTKSSEVIHEKKLGLRDLQKVSDLFEEFNELKEERSLDYDDIERTFDDGVLRLWGVRPAGQAMPGLGAGFRFCTLGEPLFDAEGNVGTGVAFSDLAAHVFFCDTGSPIPKKVDGISPLIGIFQNRAIYLLFSPSSLGLPSAKEGNVLTAAMLKALPSPGPNFIGTRVVYGEGCTVPDDRLALEGVTFKQVPYQIEGI